MHYLIAGGVVSAILALLVPHILNWVRDELEEQRRRKRRNRDGGLG